MRMRISTLVAIAVSGAPAVAQYESDFEAPGFFGSAAGMPISSGANAGSGFFIPFAGDLDGRVYSYNGGANDLGIAPNPYGGTQFAAVSRAGGAYGRVERAVTIDLAAEDSCWYLEFDLNLKYNGTPSATNYAGSVSLQPFPGGGSLVMLFFWDNVDAAPEDMTYTVRILGHAQNGSVPYLAGLPIDADGFTGLRSNRWYRFAHRIEFGANAMTGLSVRDIIDGVPTFGFVSYIDLNNTAAGHIPGYYLGGGATFAGVPLRFRIFSGGGFPSDQVAGNVVAFDNFRVIPQPRAECFGDINFDGRVSLQDLANLLSHFGQVGGLTYFDGDLDCDGDVDLNDLTLLLSEFGTICV